MSTDADLITTLESMAVGASCFDLITPKSPSDGTSIIEHNRAAISTVQEIIAERAALRAALIEVRDNAKGDSPDMWGRVELALAFATTAKARKAFEAAVVGVTRTGSKP